MANKRWYDRYWKIDFSNVTRSECLAILHDAGYYSYFTNTIYKDILVKLMDRRERQLLCYDLSANDELQQFVRNRGLAIPPETLQFQDQVRQRKAVIKFLMVVDQDPSLRRFLELPPELRNSIYELAMLHHPATLRAPTKPPLARVSRQPYREMLPIFYSQTGFELEYSRPVHMPRMSPLRTTFEMSASLMATPDQCVAHLRRFTINLRAENASGNSFTFASCDISIVVGKRAVTIRRMGEYRFTVRDLDKIKEELSKAVNTASSHIFASHEASSWHLPTCILGGAFCRVVRTLPRKLLGQIHGQAGVDCGTAGDGFLGFECRGRRRGGVRSVVHGAHLHFRCRRWYRTLSPETSTCVLSSKQIDYPNQELRTLIRTPQFHDA